MGVVVVVVAVAAASALTAASALGGSGGAVTQSVAAGSCSKGAARNEVKRLHLGNADDPTAGDPVGQVLCGAFLGPNSRAMVASLAIPSCGRTAGWVVFRRAGGAWRLVVQRNNGAELTAVGTDIKETLNVLRPRDAHCGPTGGTQSRVWHWNGTRFTAGPWQRTESPKPVTPKPVTTVHLYYVSSPSYNIWCDVGDEDQVFCVSKTPRRAVTLTYDGAVKICSGTRCVRNNKVFQPGDPVLAYGQQDVQGPYLCKSERTGITCTLTRPGKADGKGFLINRDGVTRVG